MNYLIQLAANSPTTGDSFSPILIGIVAGIALLGIIVTTILSKKNK